MQIQSLHIYPVKGMGGCDLPVAEVTPIGLAGDRRWMLVDATGRFISQREEERLALVAVAPTADGLTARAPGQPEIAIATPAPGGMPVTIWDDQLPAYCAAAAVNDWFSDFLRLSCRLVYQGDSIRPVDPRWSRPGDATSFADAYPLLVCTSASLADLNRRAGMEFPMNRFRPNIVAAADEPWSEDGWGRLKLGSVEIDIVKPCARCVVTTIDQARGIRTGKEPLRSLAKFRFLQVPGISGAIFGQNAIPRAFGPIAVGDRIEVLDRQAKPIFKQAASASI
jgi:MOSC domain-containing protein